MDLPVPQNTSKNQNINFSLDPKLIILTLLAIIVGMLAVWQPWSVNAGGEERTVQVNGDAMIREVADEYVFYPSYQLRGTDKDAALAEMTAKSNDIIAGLKEVGVAEDNIATSSDGYNYPVYPQPIAESEEITYSLQITVTVNNQELAQKVQNYLLTTKPSGSVSPRAQFSEAKRKEVENRAREEATKDARAKAEQMAENIGFKLAKVKTITDNQGFGVMPFERDVTTMDSAVPDSSLQVQPGQNELLYSVTVTYFIR